MRFPVMDDECNDICQNKYHGHGECRSHCELHHSKHSSTKATFQQADAAAPDTLAETRVWLDGEIAIRIRPETTLSDFGKGGLHVLEIVRDRLTRAGGGKGVIDKCSHGIKWDADCPDCDRAWRDSLFSADQLVLANFYSANSKDELIAAQANHVQRLQLKLPELRDEQPKKVREG